MDSNTLPPLRTTGGLHNVTEVASMLPSSLHHAGADYIYKPQLQVYTSYKSQYAFGGVTNLATHVTAAAFVNDVDTAKQDSSGEAATFASSDTNYTAAATPHRTTAVFQAKLQRALWLDQLTSCVHAESSARAGLRCSEAEGREALWWPYQQEKAALFIKKDYTQRTSALAKARVSQQQHAVQALFLCLTEQQEPEARHAIEADAANAFQLLWLAENTSFLQFTVRKLAAERQSAEVLGKTAQEVRALELDLATRSYHAVPTFDPFLGDLERIMEGRSPYGDKEETPLDQWRRNVSQEKRASAAAAATAKRQSAALDQRVVKVDELYARRSVRYDEEKERLFCQWWKVAGDIMYVDEVAERQLLWHLASFVASPHRMAAVVVLQRWWRLQRCAPWSRQRQKKLTTALATLPHRYSSDRYKRQLRALDNELVQVRSSRGSNNVDGSISLIVAVTERLTALGTAATHPRRYAMQLELYTYTLVRKARAFCEGVGVSPALFFDDTSKMETPPEWSTVHTSGAESRAVVATPFDAWRQTRWSSYTALQSQNTKGAVQAEQRARDVICMLEKHSRDDLTNFGSVVHGGFRAFEELWNAQQSVIEEATKARQRIKRQEEHERHVLASSMSHHDAHVLRLSLRVPAVPPKSEQLECGSNTISFHAPEVSMQNSRKLGGIPQSTTMKHSAVVSAPVSSSLPLNLAKAQRCVQKAVEAVEIILQERRVKAKYGDAEKNKSASPDVRTMVNEAAQQYGVAFDRAAASVYSEQYTTVQKRLSVQSDVLLHAIEELTQGPSNGKSTISSKESGSRQGLP